MTAMRSSKWTSLSGVKVGGAGGLPLRLPAGDTFGRESVELNAGLLSLSRQRAI